MAKNAAKFVKEVRSEARKVTWSSRKEILGTTAVVIVTLFICAILFSAVDWVIVKAIQFILGIAG